MASFKEYQEKVMNYRLLGERLKGLENRRQLLIGKIMEIESTIDSIKEIESDSKADIVLPLGSGVFVNGSIKDKDKMMVMISRDIVVEMSLEKTKENLEKNKKTLENGLRITEDEMMKTQEEMEKLEPTVRDFIERQQKIEKSE